MDGHGCQEVDHPSPTCFDMKQERTVVCGMTTSPQRFV